MIAGAEKENFVVAHYEWIVVGVGVVALVAAGAFFAMGLGKDPDADAAKAVREVAQLQSRRSDNGVKAVDMTAFDDAMRGARTPTRLSEISEKGASFLASERRVKCVCGKAIPGDPKAYPKCPYCGVAQEAEKVIVLDADSDGLPDEWEKKYGLNPNDPEDANLDKDADGFTNTEEFAAKTDPADAKVHPDYLNDLKLTLPLEETHLPFVFRKANKIPSGWRLEFFDPKLKNVARGDTGVITAKIGEEIGKSGYVVKDYTAKSEKQKIKGSTNARTVDVSEVVVERKADGKKVVVVIQEKGFKAVPVDVQAKLVFSRGGSKTFDVVKGSEIGLYNEKYKVTEIVTTAKSERVVLENIATGKKKSVGALD